MILKGHERVTWVGMLPHEYGHLLSCTYVPMKVKDKTEQVEFWWVAKPGHPPVTQRREYLRLWEEPEDDDATGGGDSPVPGPDLADRGDGLDVGSPGLPGGGSGEPPVEIPEWEEEVEPAPSTPAPFEVPEWDDTEWVPEDEVF